MRFVVRGVSALLLTLLASAVAAVETLEMNLRWNFVKLASVTFYAEQKDNQQRFEIIGKTAGPLRLVKNYDGRGLLLREGSIDNYTLEGTDGGVAELRNIVFEQGKLPKVLAFKDNGAPRHLEPMPPWGARAVSPMALMYQVVKSAEQPKLCDGTYLVYDGKRRYEVSLKVSETLAAARADQVSDGLFSCAAKLSGATLRSAEDADPMTDDGPTLANAPEENGDMRQVWLFGRSDRRMDFILQPGCSLNGLREMRIQSPLGKIVGKAIGECL